MKARPEQVDIELDGYEAVWNPAEKPGYSGTLVLSRLPLAGSLTGFGCPEHQTEGRAITIKTRGLYIVTAYVPNSKEGLVRLPYRLEWERDFQAYLRWLDGQDPENSVVLCGDLNVCHNEIDIARPDSNRRSPGFSDEERAEMTRLLSSGFTDTYRSLHPGQTGAYTYWSYMGQARRNNIGWRLDYFVVSDRLMPRVISSEIRSDILGSDHCPIVLDLKDKEDAI